MPQFLHSTRRDRTLGLAGPTLWGFFSPKGVSEVPGHPGLQGGRAKSAGAGPPGFEFGLHHLPLCDLGLVLPAGLCLSDPQFPHLPQGTWHNPGYVGS